MRIFGSPKDRFDDDEIVHHIQSGGAKAEQMLDWLYRRYWPMVRGYVVKGGGAEEDAEEIYQDGMIAFYENVIGEKFQGKSSVSTYLFGICRNKWNLEIAKKERKRKAQEKISAELEQDKHIVNEVIGKDEFEYALSILEKIGEACKQLLILVHYYHYSMKEVAQKMEYKNDQIARNKHYRCNKSLEKLIAENPGLREV